jgi:hypothetical protein
MGTGMKDARQSSAPDSEAIDISVVVTVTERAESLSDLYREYAPPIAAMGRPFEFIYAVEPYYRKLTESLGELIQSGEPIQVFQSARTTGEAALLKTAGSMCRGSIVLTMPAYHRVEPTSLPGLVQAVDRGADLAMARRWPRRDAWLNRLQNRVFHMFVGGMGGDRSHDTACGVRAMRRDLLQGMPLYGEFFRFLPILATQDGYEVSEVACAQHSKDLQARIYGPGVYLRRLIDLLGLFFLARFTYKPLRFFGFIGAALGLPGLAILGWLLVVRLGGQAIAGRPMLLLGVMLATLGLQAIALGLVGEIIVHLHASAGRRYRVLAEEDRRR